MEANRMRAAEILNFPIQIHMHRLHVLISDLKSSTFRTSLRSLESEAHQ